MKGEVRVVLYLDVSRVLLEFVCVYGGGGFVIVAGGCVEAHGKVSTHAHAEKKI